MHTVGFEPLGVPLHADDPPRIVEAFDSAVYNVFEDPEDPDTVALRLELNLAGGR